MSEKCKNTIRQADSYILGYMLRKYQGENLRPDSPCPSGLCHMTLSWVGFLTLAPSRQVSCNSYLSCWIILFFWFSSTSVSAAYLSGHLASLEEQCRSYLILSVSSVQFSHSVLSDSLQPHESQHARPPYSSPTPGVHPNPFPLSQWCHPTIPSSVVPIFFLYSFSLSLRKEEEHQSEWLLSKSLQAINAGEGAEKREPSYTVGGWECKLVQPLWRTVWRFL